MLRVLFGHRGEQAVQLLRLPLLLERYKRKWCVVVMQGRRV